MYDSHGKLNVYSKCNVSLITCCHTANVNLQFFNKALKPPPPQQGRSWGGSLTLKGRAARTDPSGRLGEQPGPAAPREHSSALRRGSPAEPRAAATVRGGFPQTPVPTTSPEGVRKGSRTHPADRLGGPPAAALRRVPQPQPEIGGSGARCITAAAGSHLAAAPARPRAAPFRPLAEQPAVPLLPAVRGQRGGPYHRDVKGGRRRCEEGDPAAAESGTATAGSEPRRAARPAAGHSGCGEAAGRAGQAALVNSRRPEEQLLRHRRALAGYKTTSALVALRGETYLRRFHLPPRHSSAVHKQKRQRPGWHQGQTLPCQGGGPAVTLVTRAQGQQVAALPAVRRGPAQPEGGVRRRGGLGLGHTCLAGKNRSYRGCR